MCGNGTKLKQIQVTRRQDNTAVNTKRWDTFGYELLTLWQQAHGAPEGEVSVMTVQNGLMVLMENAFSQAELTLARQSRDNILQQYIDSLSHQILPILTRHVKQISGQQIETTSITSKIEQNWMMVFIKFAEPASFEDKL